MRAFMSCLAVSLVLGAVSCGGSSPASPSATPGTNSGATISGAVIGVSGTTTASAGWTVKAASSTATTVSVVGTSLSTVVDGTGAFTLRGVPAGNQNLQFNGPSVSGQIGLTDIQSSDDIAITVSVSGSDVVLESMRKNGGSGEELEGRVESLPPTTPADSLVVAGRTVTTSTQTVFRLNGTPATFAALQIGQRVHVTGQTSGAALAARTIDIQNTNTDIPVEINGIVQTLSGAQTAFQLTIDGRLIKGDAQTAFFGGSQFSDLAVGTRAEVKGLQKDGYVYAARIHVSVDETTPPQDDSASIEGTLTAKTGTAPLLTLTIGGTTVKTNGSTEVRRRGDVQDLSVLALNMTIHAVGTRQGDGSLLARMLQIKDDEVGGLFEISGSVGALKGTCPALSFGVNGYTVTTDGTTTFTPACSNVKPGSKVTVKGTVESDGRVKATSLTLN